MSLISLEPRESREIPILFIDEYVRQLKLTANDKPGFKPNEETQPCRNEQLHPTTF